jgi:hypothetical protein
MSRLQLNFSIFLSFVIVNCCHWSILIIWNKLVKQFRCNFDRSTMNILKNSENVNFSFPLHIICILPPTLSCKYKLWGKSTKYIFQDCEWISRLSWYNTVLTNTEKKAFLLAACIHIDVSPVNFEKLKNMVKIMHDVCYCCKKNSILIWETWRQL